VFPCISTRTQGGPFPLHQAPRQGGTSVCVLLCRFCFVVCAESQRVKEAEGKGGKRSCAAFNRSIDRERDENVRHLIDRARKENEEKEGTRGRKVAPISSFLCDCPVSSLKRGGEVEEQNEGHN